MPFELKEGQGSLFKNDKRETDKHPNAKGSCLIDGKEYWVSAWTKEGAKGKWQSLSFTPKDKQQAQPKQERPKEKPLNIPGMEGFESDIPFSNPYSGGMWRVV
jgi:hypothetical protein